MSTFLDRTLGGGASADAPAPADTGSVAAPVVLGDRVGADRRLGLIAWSRWCVPSRCGWCFVPRCRQCEYVATKAAHWCELVSQDGPPVDEESRLGYWSVLRVVPELARWNEAASEWEARAAAPGVDRA